MRRAVAVTLVLACGLGLVGCSDEQSEAAKLREDQTKRYEICVENGGSWHQDSWVNSETCTLP